ncbi:MAG: sugar O-acetyltransferase [Vulcanimicrobiota bacterium]
MKSEREKMLVGELYDPADPALVRARAEARILMNEFNNAEYQSPERHQILLKILGSVGHSPHIEPLFRFDYGTNIHLGDLFFANFDLVILDAAPVTIGDNCMLAPGVHIYTSTHPLDSAERLTYREMAYPVTIGNKVWVGGRAVINPGVTIGDGAVIASGAVVTKDVEPYTLVAGVPARPLRRVS